jgi:hypothetical protein
MARFRLGYRLQRLLLGNLNLTTLLKPLRCEAGRAALPLAIIPLRQPAKRPDNAAQSRVRLIVEFFRDYAK